MTTVRTPGQSTGPQATPSTESRRVGRGLGFVTWVGLLSLSILFTVATAGLGVFTVGIVLCVGLVAAVLGASKRT